MRTHRSHHLPLTRKIGTLAVLAALAWAGPAAAYTPHWLACTGDLTITPAATPASPAAAPTKTPAEDVYVYDDDAKTFFKYSPTRKALAFVGPGRYSDGEIAWSGSSSGIDSASWDGRLDRKTMRLSLKYTTAEDTRVWNQSCAPTSPREEAP